MSDEQIRAMLRLENNSWVQSANLLEQPQRPLNEFANAAGLAGGYEFDPRHLQQLLRECKQLRDDLAGDAQWYEILANAESVAPDEYASEPFSKGLRVFGQRQQMRNTAWIEYLDGFIAQLEATKIEYQRQEGQTAQDVSRAVQEES